MQTRTRHSIVRFRFPFSVSGVSELQPAGEYYVTEDDKTIDGLTWIAWQRVAAFIYLPNSTLKSSRRQKVPIDYAEIIAALELDRERASGNL